MRHSFPLVANVEFTGCGAVSATLVKRQVRHSI